VILVAGSSSDALARWEEVLQDFDVVTSVPRVPALIDYVLRMEPQVLLLDLDLQGLEHPRGIVNLRKASPATKIIVLTPIVSDDMELALFKAGVHGCCRSDVEPQAIKRAIVAVQRGELWIRRSITLRLLEELGARLRVELRMTDAADGRLAELTLREREIAERISNGESNKQIARQLFITERTVKAHVSGIFRKLGVGDRLSLALRVSALREADNQHAA